MAPVMRGMRAALFGLICLAVAGPGAAALNIFATVPEWGALAREIGRDKVSVFVATHALQDVHRVEAKPSLLARARDADLVLATGAELEVGWLPLVLRDCGNAAIQPGRPGYFEAASAVRLLEVPARLDRAEGDVHPGGNPHIQTDPRNILKVAGALAVRLAVLDPANAPAYREAHGDFARRWQAAIARWEREAAPLRGAPVLVQHRSFPYLIDWLGLRELGALESKPGVEPTSAHLAGIVERLKAQPARMLLRAAYQPDTAARWLRERAGVPEAVLPFTVGGTPEAKDLFGLFDDTVRRLLAAAK